MIANAARDWRSARARLVTYGRRLSRSGRGAYLLPILAWLGCGLSACQPATKTATVRLQPLLQFSAMPAAAAWPNAPLAAIAFGAQGALYTLSQDGARISGFDADGQVLCSFAGDEGSEGAALLSRKDLIYVADSHRNQLQVWTNDGRLVKCQPYARPLSAGDSAFTPDGRLLHSTEGFSDAALVVVFNEEGALRLRLGDLPPAIDSRHPTRLRESLARGRIPGALSHGVLVAGSGSRVYALCRTRPLLQCYEDGSLRFERRLSMPELAAIREATRVRNGLLPLPDVYVPPAYWNDFVVMPGGDLLILLALQTRHVIYQLDRDGVVKQKLVGEYGKGHLLAIDGERLAVADAGSRRVTVYSLPDGYGGSESNTHVPLANGDEDRARKQ